MSSHLSKIEALLESDHGEQAAQLIETLADPEIDDAILEACSLWKRTIWFLDRKQALEPRHRRLPLDAVLRLLSRRPESKAATALLDRLSVCALTRPKSFESVGVLRVSELIAMGSTVHRDGPRPPFDEVDVKGLDGCTASTLTMIAFDLKGQPLSVGPVQALSLLSCQHVVLRSAPKLERLEVVDDHVAQHQSIPPNVVSVTLRDLPRVRTLGGLRDQKRLKSLVVVQCPELDDLSEVAHAASSLENVILNLGALQSLDWLQGAAKLRTLSLDGCTKIASLKPLNDATLDALSLRGCAHLTSLEGMPRLPDQTLLDLSGCTHLRALDPLVERASALRCIDLRGCSNLNSLSPLSELPSLNAIALANTSFQPDQVDESLRNRCTWAAQPNLTLMAEYG